MNTDELEMRSETEAETQMDDSPDIEPQGNQEETTPEQAVAPVEEMPAWDFPTFEETPAAAQVDDPDVFETLKNEAAARSLQESTGVLRNLTVLESQLMRQGASAETIAFAKQTLLSMGAGASKPDAAKFASMLAIGAQGFEGKNWKAPKVTTPPPANSVGNPNPVSGNEDEIKEQAAFNKAFAALGISSDVLKDI